VGSKKLRNATDLFAPADISAGPAILLKATVLAYKYLLAITRNMFHVEHFVRTMFRVEHIFNLPD
jgi:hypothetical protein